MKKLPLPGATWPWWIHLTIPAVPFGITMAVVGRVVLGEHRTFALLVPWWIATGYAAFGLAMLWIRHRTSAQ